AARTALESSPMASVKTWRSPVLLIHGDDDRNVNFSETVTLANALRQQGVYFEQLILPDEIHSFLRHASWLRGYHAAAAFQAAPSGLAGTTHPAGVQPARAPVPMIFTASATAIMTVSGSTGEAT